MQVSAQPLHVLNIAYLASRLGAIDAAAQEAPSGSLSLLTLVITRLAAQIVS
jgi:hypothetical protein